MNIFFYKIGIKFREIFGSKTKLLKALNVEIAKVSNPEIREMLEAKIKSLGKELEQGVNNQDKPQYGVVADARARMDRIAKKKAQKAENLEKARKVLDGIKV